MLIDIGVRREKDNMEFEKELNKYKNLGQDILDWMN